ncbi:MAG TPA: hypothetical protein VII97_03860 [Anaerolineales bacterium]
MSRKWKHYLISLFVATSLVGCTLAAGTPAAGNGQPSGGATSTTLINTSPTGSPTPTSTEAATDTPGPTATPEPPSDAVVVNTFDQEVYPFQQNGNCSLGEAIQTVLTQQAVDGCNLPSGSMTVYLPAGTYTLTAADNAPAVLFGKMPQKDRQGLPPAGFPLIASQLTLLGNGSIIQRTGSTMFGIFQVFVGGNLTLKDLTITGGDVTQEQDGSGGALDIFGGTVILDHVTLTGNLAQWGGAIDNEGGGVGTAGGLTLVDSLVTKNISWNNGGGIENNGNLVIRDSEISSNVSKSEVFGGGGIYNDGGTITLDHSRLVGNLALEGGGLYNDGGVVNIVNQSIVSGNVASETNASIPHGGGGINSIGSAELTIQDSYFIGNQAPGTTGGGIYNQARLTVTGSVFAANVSGGGGALFNDSEGLGSITGSCILQNRVMGVTPEGAGNGIDSGSDTPFDASQDWWGSAAGPGNSVTTGVNAAAFLNAAPLICSATLPTSFPTPATP